MLDILVAYLLVGLLIMLVMAIHDAWTDSLNHVTLDEIVMVILMWPAALVVLVRDLRRGS